MKKLNLLALKTELEDRKDFYSKNPYAPMWRWDSERGQLDPSIEYEDYDGTNAPESVETYCAYEKVEIMLDMVNNLIWYGIKEAWLYAEVSDADDDCGLWIEPDYDESKAAYMRAFADTAHKFWGIIDEINKSKEGSITIHFSLGDHEMTLRVLWY